MIDVEVLSSLGEDLLLELLGLVTATGLSLSLGSTTREVHRHSCKSILLGLFFFFSSSLFEFFLLLLGFLKSPSVITRDIEAVEVLTIQ